MLLHNDQSFGSEVYVSSFEEQVMEHIHNLQSKENPSAGLSNQRRFSSKKEPTRQTQLGGDG